jgi:hypothetical protein
LVVSTASDEDLEAHLELIFLVLLDQQLDGGEEMAAEAVGTHRVRTVRCQRGAVGQERDWWGWGSIETWQQQGKVRTERERRRREIGEGRVRKGGERYRREEELRHHKETSPVVSPNTPSSRLPLRGELYEGEGEEREGRGRDRRLLASSGYSEAWNSSTTSAPSGP